VALAQGITSSFTISSLTIDSFCPTGFALVGFDNYPGMYFLTDLQHRNGKQHKGIQHKSKRSHQGLNQLFATGGGGGIIARTGGGAGATITSGFSSI